MSRRMVPRLGPELVGRRVVVRRRVPGGRFADLLGELVAWDSPPGLLRVRTRHGEVDVAIADVVAGKPVPPAPARRGSPHRTTGWESLEDIAADGWRPLELGWLGVTGQGWRLRAAEGFTGRGNSALAVGATGLDDAAAVDAVTAWYRERGLRPRVCLPWPLDADRLADGARDVPPDAELRRRGWQLDTPTLVLTANLRDVAGATVRPGRAGLADGLTLDVAERPDDAWLAVYRYRGQALPPVALTLLMSAPAQCFVSVRDGSTTVAVGRGASARGWAGVTAMDVAASHRRQGLGRAVLGAVAEWALRRGDRSAYLQVAETNAAARALYGDTGFADHHGYHYRLAPAPVG